MAKKNNKKSAEDQPAAQELEKTEEQKVLDQTNQTESAADQTELLEEQKVPQEEQSKPAGLKRHNSRIHMQRAEEDETKLFRPEFGKAEK